ncbi:MAG: cysteine hydrolase [Actinobacteria bacterium]|nr:MAG: cysteine hydrolase [Actinomycetota bacterium]
MIDVLADFDHGDGELLLASFRERGAGMCAAIARAREAGVPVIYVNDDRDRWDSDAPALAREAASGPRGDVVGQLLPRAGDHVLLKHRYSAFDHTALELLLASLRVGRVLLVGSATEGVVQTAPDVREHGLKATILVDARAQRPTNAWKRRLFAMRRMSAASEFGGLAARRRRAAMSGSSDLRRG